MRIHACCNAKHKKRFCITRKMNDDKMMMMKKKKKKMKTNITVHVNEKIPDNRNLILHLFSLYDKRNQFASGTNGPSIAWTIVKLRCDNEQQQQQQPPHFNTMALAKHLSITNNRRGLIHAWNAHGVILLRPWNGEKELVIGCGNSPFMFGSVALKKSLRRKLDATVDMPKDSVNAFEKLSKHVHDGAYTINPDPGMNPSVIARFGIDDLGFIPSGSIKRVFYEGTTLADYNNKNTIATLLRILSNGGIVSTSLNFKDDDGDVDVHFMKYGHALYQSNGSLLGFALRKEEDYAIMAQTFNF